MIIEASIGITYHVINWGYISLVFSLIGLLLCILHVWQKLICKQIGDPMFDQATIHES
jgi:hypothetical protein